MTSTSTFTPKQCGSHPPAKCVFSRLALSAPLEEAFGTPALKCTHLGSIWVRLNVCYAQSLSYLVKRTSQMVHM